MNNQDKDENRYDENRTDDAGDYGERGRIVPDRERLDHSRSADEQTLQDREKMAEARENSAYRRENMVHAREDQAHMREGRAAARERGIRSAEALQSATADQMLRLKQANEKLVVATLEARKLAEQVQAAKSELHHLAHHDTLTGLPNRILILDRLAQAIALARRSGKRFAVMFIDLDGFKHINDSLGHGVGDQLLQSVGECLLGCVRQSDTISRQGGDEFVALLLDIDYPESAALSAQKILEAIARSHRIKQHDLRVGASIGISIYPDDGEEADILIKHADIAMYHAKAKGRNTYAFFEQDMTTRAIARQSTENDLRLALERQEFVLHYQPKIELHSGKVVGMEALLRWQHPERGLLIPADFVSIAEDSGLIVPIGRWVLREACRQTAVWQEAGLPPVSIAVNTSALEFRAGDFSEFVRATLEEWCLEPRYLELELTESVLMGDAVSADAVLRALADMGVKLAIDDFGTGYSSLSYLRQFPIHTLKIDQSFVNEITSNPDDATIVRAIISMGKSLKQRVIAEGVETAEQADFLLAQHCDEGQGNFFSPPVGVEALTVLLQKSVSSTLSH